MIIAIDSDVMKASLTDTNCKQMMAQVWDKVESLRIAVDDKGVMLQEYYQFLEQNFEAAETHPAIKLLQDVLLIRADPRRQIILPLPTEMPASLEKAIQKHNCTANIEPQLLALAANAKNLELRLLLAGTGINARLRHRGLNDPQVRRALRKEIPWLEVHFASDRKELFTPPLIIHEKARTFEYMVAITLQTEHPTLRCVKTPDGVKNQLRKQEDIDLYGYEENGDTLIVWVGECKLRKEGKEKSKPIRSTDMQQLPKRMEASRQYEQSRPDLAGKKVQIRGLIISNAQDLFDDVTRQEAKKLEIEYWHAKLTSGWTTDLHWEIRQLSRKL